MRVRIPEIQLCRLRRRVGFEFAGRDHAADCRRFPDVTYRILRMQVRLVSRKGP